MKQKTWLNLLEQNRIIAVIRCNDIQQGLAMAQAVATGGIKLIEITWNSDQPAVLIHQLRSLLPDCIIGAGTILNSQDLKNAIAVGSQFIFTPHTDLNLIEIAQKNGIPIIPGALTPTEIITAWNAGANSVKIFPIQSVGGAEYLKHIQAPLPQIPLIPTGGVNIKNASQLIESGAIAVGLGGDLFPKDLVLTENLEAITLRAKQIFDTVKNCK
jgi:2-dehydro-3-deoxyphosphogluconate aldolase / (4S)-4-hydroxy-2-oxoglutarate aldolase